MKLTTPPLAPKVVEKLAQWDILSVADLCKLNPCHAFLLLKQSGLTVTKSVFWQLVALCEQTQIAHLSLEQRTNWQEKLNSYPPVALFPTDEHMAENMRVALAQARLAAQIGEIPIGAILLHQGKIIAQAHNLCVAGHSVCQHAEIQVIEQAGKILQNYRLDECDLYVTLEPCAMCVGAIVQARIRRLIFAAPEPKMGAAGSVLNIFANKRLNSHTAVKSGILADESKAILQQFFQQKRK